NVRRDVLAPSRPCVAANALPIIPARLFRLRLRRRPGLRRLSASTCWPTGYAIGWIHRRERADAASPFVFGCERRALSSAAASTAARISRQPPNGRSVSAQLRDAANTAHVGRERLTPKGLPRRERNRPRPDTDCAAIRLIHQAYTRAHR